MWYNLRIGTFNLKYTPLNPIEVDFPYCDDKGNALTKIAGKYEKGYFLDEKGNRFENAFKLINGKPLGKLKKTKEVDKYKEVDLKEVDDLIVEREILVYCDELLRDLEDTETAFKFGFTFGNGFKVYKAYIYPSKLYKGFLFMSLGTTQKSEVINEVVNELKQKKKVEEVGLTIQGIDRAKVEDLIEI